MFEKMLNINNKEAWGMDSTQRRFCKKKGKIEV
jgi:hypothetical protein